MRTLSTMHSMKTKSSEQEDNVTSSITWHGIIKQPRKDEMVVHESSPQSAKEIAARISTIILDHNIQ